MFRGPLRAQRAATALLIGVGASLLLAQVHPFGDAQLFAAARSGAAALPASIPPAARSVLAADCADCHSARTRTPLYGRFAPVSWLLERDIVEAREHMNLSAWDGYDADKQQDLLAEIAEQAKAGHMPPEQYVVMHRNARLKNEDVAALLAWVHAAQDADRGTMGAADEAVGTAYSGAELAVVANTASQAAEVQPGDAKRGADLFDRRCTGCHTLAQSREGPRLGGVYGRAAASVPGFPYSDALKNAHITWNEETLEKWLTDPDAFVAGVNMDFRVPKAQERADIIAYLKTVQ